MVNGQQNLFRTAWSSLLTRIIRYSDEIIYESIGPRHLTIYSLTLNVTTARHGKVSSTRFNFSQSDQFPFNSDHLSTPINKPLPKASRLMKPLMTPILLL